MTSRRDNDERNPRLLGLINDKHSGRRRGQKNRVGLSLGSGAKRSRDAIWRVKKRDLLGASDGP